MSSAISTHEINEVCPSREKTRVAVTGAGGFIGHHLVRYLKDAGYSVRGVDIKLPEYEKSAADEFVQIDLRDPECCARAVRNMSEVYHLAADMGGIGYITGSHADIARNNSLMNIGMLEAARQAGVARFLFPPRHASIRKDYRSRRTLPR